jgi:hypothetical protein
MGFGQVIENGRTTEGWKVAYTQTIRVRYGQMLEFTNLAAIFVVPVLCPKSSIQV